MLVPATGEAAVALFTQVRDARRAIQRTERVATQLKGSLIDDWLALTPLQSGQLYAILPLAHSS